MGRPSFPEAVAFERSNSPMPPDATPSMKLRRELLHGNKVTAGTAASFGATKSLVYVLVRTMRDWGFDVQQGTLGDGDHDTETCYWITNLNFVPGERIVKVVRRPQEPTAPKLNGTSKNWSKMTDGIPEGIRVIDPKSTRAAIIKRLAAGDLLTAKMIQEQHDTDPSMLRKAVSAFESAGYSIEKTKIDGTVAYGVDMTVPRKTGRTATKQTRTPRPRQTTRDLVHAPLPTVPVAPGGDWMPAVNGITPVPHLDEGLVVFLTYRDEDGDVRVGIRNGDQRWLCRVEGHVDLDAFSAG